MRRESTIEVRFHEGQAVEEMEVKVFVNGVVKTISSNLKMVLAKDIVLTTHLKDNYNNEEYVVRRPKLYYKTLAKEVGVENLLSALKELRTLKVISILGVTRLQEFKLALMK